MYWGHDLDLSGSRDVIGHVTIGLGMGHFLLVVLWTQVSVSNGFRDIPPQTSCAQRHNAKSPLRMRVSRDIYPYLQPSPAISGRYLHFRDNRHQTYWGHDLDLFGPKYIGVTTLTFLGHVTSSVT